MNRNDRPLTTGARSQPFGRLQSCNSCTSCPKTRSANPLGPGRPLASLTVKILLCDGQQAPAQFAQTDVAARAGFHYYRPA